MDKEVTKVFHSLKELQEEQVAQLQKENKDLQRRIDTVLKCISNLLKSDEVPYIDAVLIIIQEILKGDDTNE